MPRTQRSPAFHKRQAGPANNRARDEHEPIWQALFRTTIILTLRFAEEQGTVAFALGVGPDGRVKRCTIVQSSGHESLDRATCAIMQTRARFVPALDDAGRPTSDTVSSRIRWVLPER